MPTPHSTTLKPADFFVKSICVLLIIMLLSDFFKLVNINIFFALDALKRIIWCSSVLILFFYFAKGRVHMPLSKTLVFLTMTLAILSSFQYADRTLLAILQLFLTFSFFFQLAAFSNIYFSVYHFNRVRNFFVWMIMPVAFYAIFESLFGIPSLSSLTGFTINHGAIIRSDLYASTAVFNHPGTLAWILSFVACLCFSEWVITRKRSSGFLFAILCFALFLTMRKKSIIALLIAIIIILWITRHSFVTKFFSIAIVFVGFLLLIIVFGDFFDAISSSLRINDALQGQFTPRLKLTLASFEIASSNFPLGGGLSTFGSLTSVLSYSPLYDQTGISSQWGLSSDNTSFLLDTFWPMLIGEIGFIGAACYFFCLLVFTRKIYKCIQNSQNNEVKLILIVALMLLIKSIFESFSTPIFSKMPYSLFIAFFCGIAISIARRERILR